MSMDAVIKHELLSDSEDDFLLAGSDPQEHGAVKTDPEKLVEYSPHSTDETTADVGDVKCEYESDPEYDDKLSGITLEQRRVKAEPAQEDIKEDCPHSTDETTADVGDVKCEYESDPEYDDKLRRITPEQRRVKAEPAQEDIKEDCPHSTDETTADVGDVKCEYESDPEYDDKLRRITPEQRRVKAEPAQEDIKEGGAAQRAEPERRKQAAETVSVQQAHQSRGDATTAPGDRRHQCTVCHKCFCESGSLNRHFRLHTGEKPHECNICHKAFVRKDGLQMHLRVHIDEKPFKCNICQRQFCQKSHLKSHLRRHTGEKPFECTICQRRFSLKNYLQQHLRTHTGEKSFECNICHKAFARKNYLQIHIRIHTDEFECNICQCRFTHKSHLKIHLRIHTGEKPFKCNICQHQFSEKSKLQSHLRRHTGEKPYECNICQRRFSQKSNLKRHLKRHR